MQIEVDGIGLILLVWIYFVLHSSDKDLQRSTPVESDFPNKQVIRQQSFLFLQLVLEDDRFILMAKDIEEDKHLIQDVIFYGILEPQKLNLEELTQSCPKVGVLMHFTPQGPIFKEGESQQFEMWAFPDGLKVYDHCFQVINDLQPEFSFGEVHSVGLGGEQPCNYIYNFVHTDYSLNRTYFSALCWHEKRYISMAKERKSNYQKSIYSNSLPKCTLWELENDPQLNNQDQVLVYLPQIVILGSKFPLFKLHRQMLKFFYLNFLSQKNPKLLNSSLMDYFKDLVYVAGYPLAEQEFDQIIPDISQPTYQEISQIGLHSYYLSLFFLPRVTSQGETTRIVDFGHRCVDFEEVETGIGHCFWMPNVDMLRIIKRVGIKNVISLWKSLLLERHILVFSMNNRDVVDLFESLLYLIEPVRWENIYIPFLPFHLISNIDAIQSYLIGVSKIHMDYVIDHYSNQMKEVVLFDLDENLLLENTSSPVNLPQPILEVMELRLSSLGLRENSSFFSFFGNSSESVMTEREKVFRLKSIFFDALIYLLNNYRPFASLRDQNLLSFDREGYKAIFQDSEWRQFASQITETMIFVRLCEYHLDEQKRLRWNQSNIGGLFVYCQNIIQQKHHSNQFWVVPDCKKRTFRWPSAPYSEYLEYRMSKDLSVSASQKEVISIEKYLVKYLNWVEVQESEDLLLSRGNTRKDKTLMRSVVEFLVPWIKELETGWSEEQDQILQVKIGLVEVIDLRDLFGYLKPANYHENSFGVENLREELARHRKKKMQLMPVKLRRKHTGEPLQRASV